MIENLSNEKTTQFFQTERFGSVLRYSHPLSSGGVVVLLHSDAPCYLDEIALAYRMYTHGSIYCVRREELFQLWQPGVFAPPFHTNEHPHLPYCLKYKSERLAGDDFRAAIELPNYGRGLVVFHVEACRDSLRRYGILPMLFAQKYGKLIHTLKREISLLMATVLLAHGQWDVTLDSIAVPFAQLFPIPGLNETAARLAQFTESAATQQTALDAVFTFEQFLTQLEQSV